MLITADPARFEATLPEVHAMLARALQGDELLLERCLDRLHPQALDRIHRLAPAIYLRYRERLLQRRVVGFRPLEGWQVALRNAAARCLVLEEVLLQLGESLARENVDWAPLKGNDLARRFYNQPGERPTADVDILVPARHLERVRRRLESDGCRGLHDGLAEALFLHREGYCWQATTPQGALLEVHFRLWGMVPERMAAEILELARPDPPLGATALALLPEHAYLVGAVHIWQDEPPHPLIGFFDLERIALRSSPGDPDTLASAIAISARRFDLQLPVTLAALYAWSLFRNPVHWRAASLMLPQLRLAERAVLRRYVARGPDAISLARLQAARLLARRESRSGWRAAWRRAWPHAGLVARRPPNEPWLLRRLGYTFRRMRARGARTDFLIR